MKVVHILNHFMPRQVAGTEMYVFALQQQLQHLGIHGCVIVPGFDQEGFDHYVFEGVEVYSYPQPIAPNHRVVIGIDHPSGLSKFCNLLERLKPDLLHFHEINNGNGISVFHAEAAKASGYRIMFTMHLVGYVCNTGTLLQNRRFKCDGAIGLRKCATCSLVYRGIPSRLSSLCSHLSVSLFRNHVALYGKKLGVLNVLGRAELIDRQLQRLHRIVACCDQIIVLNGWFADMLVKNGVSLSKIKIVEQGLPSSPGFEGEPVFSKPVSAKLRFVFIGRVYPAKGLDLLIKAVCKLPPSAYELDIYGPVNDTAYQQYCEALIEKGHAIYWKGLIPAGKAVSVLKNYDALCLPSVVTEMAPLVIQEAFAARIPVLASDVYGNAVSIKHRVNGLLFECNSVASLQQQLQVCIDEPSLLQKLQQQIQQPRSFSAVAKDYSAVYQQLMIET